MGWQAERRANFRLGFGPTAAAMLGLGLFGYYLASYLDFLVLHGTSAPHLERLILFVHPTLVILLGALPGKPVTRRAPRRAVFMLCGHRPGGGA